MRAATRLVIMNTSAHVENIQSLSDEDLAHVTGGGVISQIMGLFGEKGARFGSMAENLFAKLRGLGGGGGQPGQPAA